MNENDSLSQLNNCLTKPIAERKLSPHEIGNLIKTANQTHSLLKISEVMNLKDKKLFKSFYQNIRFTIRNSTKNNMEK